MQVIKDEYITTLIADEGKRITNKKRDIFVEKIYLPPTSDINEYEEVERDLWKYFIKEENPDITELQAQNQDINDNLDIIMTAIADIDEQNNMTIDVMLLAIDELYTMVASILPIDEGGE